MKYWAGSFYPILMFEGSFCRKHIELFCIVKKGLHLVCFFLYTLFSEKNQVLKLNFILDKFLYLEKINAFRQNPKIVTQIIENDDFQSVFNLAFLNYFLFNFDAWPIIFYNFTTVSESGKKYVFSFLRGSSEESKWVTVMLTIKNIFEYLYIKTKVLKSTF